MRVLWFVNIPFPEASIAMGIQPNLKGGWMPSLGHAISETGKVELGVASIVGVPTDKRVEIDRIVHFGISNHGRSRRLQDREMSLIIGKALEVVEGFSPDLIHVHGTEGVFGRLSGEKLTTIPTVISLQGMMGVYKDYLMGGLSSRDAIRCHLSPEWIRGSTLYQTRRRWRLSARLEEKVISSNTVFIGRTTWDKAHVLAVNPKACYYHCDEIMRPPFYTASWKPGEFTRHSIYVNSGSSPLKGFHTLLKAASLLKGQFPRIQIRVSDALPKGRARWKGYVLYLNGLIKKLRLEKHVFPLGMLNQEGVLRELQAANIFVLPSFIENSPNALAEAMLVGTPSVVSFVGGVPSMVTDRITALCFPPGDEAVLAECVRTLFDDDALAENLSVAARVTAMKRHSKERIVSRMIDIYSDVIQGQSA